MIWKKYSNRKPIIDAVLFTLLFVAVIAYIVFAFLWVS